MKKRNMIWQYIRNRKRQKVGIVCARNLGDGKVAMGYSMCNKNYDKFDFKTGIRLAIERSHASFDKNEIPLTANNAINKFAGRCLKYFEYQIFIIDNIDK